MGRRLVVAGLALLAGGCALGPNYERPKVPVPPTWREIPVAEAQSLANSPWWELFDDPQLQELIRVALVENKDLKIAVERIEEARARYGFTKADLWPKVDLNGTAGAIRFSQGSLIHTPAGDLSANRDPERPIYATTADMSWEIDFLGRIRRATEAQKALFLGTEEARRSAVLTLVADVARAYFELRDFDRRLEVARRTIESRRESVQLAKDRYEGGITPEMDFRQAEAELHRVEVVVFDLEFLIAAKESELSVLLGRNPGAITRGRSLDEQKLPAAVPAGLPSELLDRRPDVRVAEQDLAAATANIGQAKAMLFPRIALTGSFGFASTDFDTLFEGPSKSWNIIGNLLQPLFNAGKNKRRLQITESQQRQILYSYERTIIQAFRETEDALMAYRKTGEQQQAQTTRVDAERKVVELAELRYRGGVAAYLEVLDAQRSLFEAELDQAQTMGSHLVSLVQLYKALGGGWPPAPEPTTAADRRPLRRPLPPGAVEAARPALGMKALLAFCAALEAATGLTLMIQPSLLTRLILGAEVAGAAGAGVSRLAGFALMGLALACWPFPRTPEAAAAPLRAMFTYNVLITAYLAYVGLGGEGAGPLLWPTVAAHAVLTLLLGRALLAGRATPAG